MYSHGNYTLAPGFAAFTVPHAVWQVKSQEDKDTAFGEFLAHTVRRKRTAMVTLSNSVLTVPARPNIARKKPGRRKHARAERVSQAEVTTISLALFRATTFSRTRPMYFYYACHYHSIAFSALTAVGWAAGRESGL